MAKRKNVRSNQQYDQALALERTGDQAGAIKLYQKAVTTDPLNVRAWNRLMVLFRKAKSKEDEVKLIQTAITQVKEANELAYEIWLKDHQEKANSTRELAKALGLIEENGMPTAENDLLEKWHTRLYLLEYRLKNARNKPKKASKKPKSNKKATAKPKPAAANQIKKNSSAKQIQRPRKQLKKTDGRARGTEKV
jgi:tetratricopeptide (TPR) repeat protein